MPEWVALAGPEAEARRVSAMTGVTLPQARAEILRANPADTGQADRLLRSAGVNRTEAAVRAQQIAAVHSVGIAMIALELAVRAPRGEAVPAAAVRAASERAYVPLSDGQYELGETGAVS